MKVTTTEKPRAKEEKYPFLGSTHQGNIVILFYAENCGIILKSNSPSMYRVGQNVEINESNASLYKGEVTLSND